jgi:MGT family glycosyltransferase
MARFLFISIPASGHVNPGLPIAAELVRRGHDVRWYTTERFKKAVEKIGVRYVPFVHCIPYDEAKIEEQFPERKNYKGMAQMKFDMKTLFIDSVPMMLRDLEEELARCPADVIVGDNTCGVAGVLHEKHGIPWAVFGISVFTWRSADTPPFGLGLTPNPSPMGRLRDKFLYWMSDNVLFKETNDYYYKTRESLGLKKVNGSLFDFVKDCDLYLQSSVPEFEYPRANMPSQVRFIGSHVPEPPENWTPPRWWSELDGKKKVVLVTQGTIANDYDDLIRPAIRALASEDVQVVVTTGSKPAGAVEMDLPANTRVEQFIPYAHLMPKVDLLVTNGGYGSIQIALSHGVPVIAIGKSEEKPEIAARVNWTGVGVGIKEQCVAPERILQAVKQVLGDNLYRLKAKEMQVRLANTDASQSAANLLEELAGVPGAVPVGA